MRLSGDWYRTPASHRCAFSPGCNKRRPEDAANLLAFLKTLRSVLGHEKVITAAVSTEGFLGPDGQPLSDFSDYGKYLDYINLMTLRPPLTDATSVRSVARPDLALFASTMWRRQSPFNPRACSSD